MKKIAVVEDNPDNRLLARVMLESFYEVVEYETGFAALEGIPKEKPDLVLLDISLPQLDGAEVLRRLRSEAALRHLPIIALTAHAMAGDREKYLAAGFNDYVGKPIIDEQVLLEAIRQQLSPEVSGAAPCGPPRAGRRKQRPWIDCAVWGRSIRREMVDLFVRYVHTQLCNAQAAAVARDCAGVAKAVHPIRSSAGNVGASRVQELAARLEQTALKQELPEMKRLLGELEAAFAEVKPRLEAEKKKCKRTP
jgi:CheY-like chemotaxis protein/HPt (histidine-containing phosphotransfer) domain-containing protein